MNIPARSIIFHRSNTNGVMQSLQIWAGSRNWYSETMVSCDDALLNMVTIPEIFSNLHSELYTFATIERRSMWLPKMDAAIKIKGFIFLEFANSLRSR